MTVKPEGLTWLGYERHRDGKSRENYLPTPVLKVGHFGYDRQALSHDWARNMDNAHGQLRGQQFSRLQLFGYSRMDDLEMMQLECFAAMLYELSVLPPEKPAEFSLRADAISIGHNFQPGRPAFLYIHADIYTNDEARLLYEKISRRTYDPSSQTPVSRRPTTRSSSEGFTLL